MESRARAAESLLATSTGKDALEHAIRAAELYMQAAEGETVTKTEASRLRRRCRELIAHAEGLKAQLRRPSTSASTTTPPPLSSLTSTPSASPFSLLSKGELEILRQASRLHGGSYAIWESYPTDAEFQLRPDGQVFVDNTDFPLSLTQKTHFESWKRPRELFEVHNGEDDDFMTLKEECDLVQDVTTDCSVVASLSAAAAVLTGRHLLLSSMIYPFDNVRKQPKLSPSGKYIVRMNFNGCCRRVVIDDRLPASRTNRALFVIDKQNPRLIWPALLEKAYLKARGGYDFPGSNSGTDLWVLTGWIPEQIFLQREDFDLDETWSRIREAYAVQDVVVTLGTGRVSKEEETTMGLVEKHDYAVQDMRSIEGSRSLLIKNPWSHGRGQAAASSTLSGVFWMPIEEVAQHFESMYLNWRPALFPHRQDRHFSWTIPPKHFHISLARNPQYSLTIARGGAVWILLSRHFTDAELQIARNKSDGEALNNRHLGFMNISVYRNHGKRVYLGDELDYQGPYVDSPQTLARIHASHGKPYTIVVDQQELPLTRYTFTLSVFAHSPIELELAKEKMPHSKELIGAWKRRTAGGNSSCSTYFLNPQFKLTVPSPGSVSVLLSTDNSDIHVHVDAVWGRGQRARTVRARDLVASSGEYRRGCAVADIAELDAGTYTLVCSTFEAGQTAAFVLLVTSAMAVGLETVPAAVAGRLRNSVGPLRCHGGSQQWRAMLTVSSLTRASASVRALVPQTEAASEYLGGRSRSNMMMRLSIVRGRGSQCTVLGQSGDGGFQDSTAVISTPELDLEPEWTRDGAIWLVLESMGSDQTVTTVNGEIFSDVPVQMGAWEAQNINIPPTNRMT